MARSPLSTAGQWCQLLATNADRFSSRATLSTMGLPVLHRETPVGPIGWVVRLWAAAIAAACLAVLLVASGLQPSAAGVGTHLQLGLPPCSMMVQAGVPCPSCGMTTSFSYLVRGQVARAFDAQPAGALLAVLTGLVFWAGTYVVITGKAVHRLLRPVPAWGWAAGVIMTVLVGWAWKVGRVIGWW